MKKFEHVVVGILPISKNSKYFCNSLFDKNTSLDVLFGKAKQFSISMAKITTPNEEGIYSIPLIDYLGEAAGISVKYTAQEIVIYADVTIADTDRKLDFFEEQLLPNLVYKEEDNESVASFCINPTFIAMVRAGEDGGSCYYPDNLIYFQVCQALR